MRQVLLLQLGKGGLKLLDQNMFFKSAREAKKKTTIREVANKFKPSGQK